MTIEEAIKMLKSKMDGHTDTSYEWTETVRMAIKALQLLGVIDVIKAEIKEEAECAYADFERYKVDYLGQDWEDVLDSLPQDDFRYGMERCIDIINQHISGKEQE